MSYTDTHTLILAAYVLTAVSVGIISMLTFDRVIRAKYPRLLDTAIWCLLGALTLAIAEVLR
jgi:hypothetical protein